MPEYTVLPQQEPYHNEVLQRFLEQYVNNRRANSRADRAQAADDERASQQVWHKQFLDAPDRATAQAIYQKMPEKYRSSLADPASMPVGDAERVQMEVRRQQKQALDVTAGRAVDPVSMPQDDAGRVSWSTVMDRANLGMPVLDPYRSYSAHETSDTLLRGHPQTGAQTENNLTAATQGNPGLLEANRIKTGQDMNAFQDATIRERTGYHGRLTDNQRSADEAQQHEQRRYHSGRLGIEQQRATAYGQNVTSQIDTRKNPPAKNPAGAPLWDVAAYDMERKALDLEGRAATLPVAKRADVQAEVDRLRARATTVRTGGMVNEIANTVRRHSAWSSTPAGVQKDFLAAIQRRDVPAAASLAEMITGEPVQQPRTHAVPYQTANPSRYLDDAAADDEQQ